MSNLTVTGNVSLTTTVITATSIASNSTENEELCIRHPLYQNVMIVLFIAAVVLSTIENFLLWAAFIANKGLRTQANMYVVSLSVSDFITTASLGWLEIYYVWEYPYWVFAETGSFVQNGFWCLSLVTPFVHITIITFDRYHAVASTKNYRKRTSFKRDIIVISLMWVYSIGITLLMSFHFAPAPGYEYQWNVLPEWYYPFIGVHITIPLFVCSFLYLHILQIAKKSRKEINSYQEEGTKQEFKLAKTIAVIIVLLFAVWLPVIAMEVIYAVLAHTCAIAQVGTISVWLTCTSGVLNPLVFFWKNKKFRKTVLTNVLCFKEKGDAYQHSNNTTRTNVGNSTVRTNASTTHVNPSYVHEV